MNILSVPVRPPEEPLSADTEAWARQTILDPATEPRVRRMISDLLAEIEAAR